MDRSREFQAPKCVDFNNLEVGEDADDFFNVDMESGVSSEEIPQHSSDLAPPRQDLAPPPQDLVPPPQDFVPPSEDLATPPEAPSDAAANVDEAFENPPVDSEKPNKLRNMVTSWGSGASTKTMTTALAKPETALAKPAAALAKSAAQAFNPARKIPKGDEEILRQAVAQSIEAARNSPRRTGTIPKQLGTNTSEPRLGAPSSRALSSESDVAKSLNKPSAMRTRTLSKSPGTSHRATSRGQTALPRTPDILKRARNCLGQTKEANKVEVQLAENRKQVEKAKRAPPAKPVAVTKPLEFKFAKDAWVEEGGKVVGEKDEKDFTSTLRSYTKGSSLGDSCSGMTVPKTFPHMEMARKRHHSADAKTPSKFVSMAEKLSISTSATCQDYVSKNTPQFSKQFLYEINIPGKESFQSEIFSLDDSSNNSVSSESKLVFSMHYESDEEVSLSDNNGLQSQAKLAGVFKRLSYQTKDAVGIEANPTSRAGRHDAVKVEKESKAKLKQSNQSIANIFTNRKKRTLDQPVIHNKKFNLESVSNEKIHNGSEKGTEIHSKIDQLEIQGPKFVFIPDEGPFDIKIVNAMKNSVCVILDEYKESMKGVFNYMNEETSLCKTLMFVLGNSSSFVEVVSESKKVNKEWVILTLHCLKESSRGMDLLDENLNRIVIIGHFELNKKLSVFRNDIDVKTYLPEVVNSIKFPLSSLVSIFKKNNQN